MRWPTGDFLAAHGERPAAGRMHKSSTTPGDWNAGPATVAAPGAVGRSNSFLACTYNENIRADRVQQFIGVCRLKTSFRLVSTFVYIWDLVIVRSCPPLFAGRQYRLTLTASADLPVTVRVRVREPYGVVMSFSADMRLGPQPRRLNVPFVAQASTRQGELMFQVGGSPADYRLRVTASA